MTTLGIDPVLLDLLRCPKPHHAPVRVDEAAEALVCTECGAAYPVRDGVPIMLIDEARELGATE